MLQPRADLLRLLQRPRLPQQMIHPRLFKLGLGVAQLRAGIFEGIAPLRQFVEDPPGIDHHLPGNFGESLAEAVHALAREIEREDPVDRLPRGFEVGV